jgi:NAD(P)-dependent dehydrogenase (short-subunit alcohol dehydrogenase family)
MFIWLPRTTSIMLGAVALSLAAGAAPAGAASSATATPLSDPTTKFPIPPFPDQKQPWPGLASKMNPKPDHGESRRQQAHDSILELSTEQFDWTMKTNIYAPFWIIKSRAAQHAGGSCIIATTSEQPYDPTPDLYWPSSTGTAFSPEMLRISAPFQRGASGRIPSSRPRNTRS